MHAVEQLKDRGHEQQASRGEFMKDFFNYRIIQLYTHASDSSERGEPIIYFSDSAMYLSDLISESKPATRLIVLSACETAGGKLYQGEGVFNFNRGFAALGVQACITSLWAVEDQSTYELMQSFYGYLAEGLPTEKKKKKAKIDFLRNEEGEKKLPSYWAAPILAGKTDQFNFKNGTRFGQAGLLVGISLLVIVTALFFGRRRQKTSPSRDRARTAA